jgi:hypothetical protein
VPHPEDDVKEADVAYLDREIKNTARSRRSLSPQPAPTGLRSPVATPSNCTQWVTDRALTSTFHWLAARGDFPAAADAVISGLLESGYDINVVMRGTRARLLIRAPGSPAGTEPDKGQAGSRFACQPASRTCRRGSAARG